MSEADTCRKYVAPKLQSAGWDNDPHSATAEFEWRTALNNVNSDLMGSAGVPPAAFGVSPNACSGLEREMAPRARETGALAGSSPSPPREAKAGDRRLSNSAPMNFLLFILTLACKEFEQRVGQLKSPRDAKTGLIEAAIERQTGAFRVSDLQSACPGVGVDLIRQVLKRGRGSRVTCLGRGLAAHWKKLSN